jgi:hypothetical protein
VDEFPVWDGSSEEKVRKMADERGRGSDHPTDYEPHHDEYGRHGGDVGDWTRLRGRQLGGGYGASSGYSLISDDIGRGGGLEHQPRGMAGYRQAGGTHPESRKGRGFSEDDEISSRLGDEQSERWRMGRSNRGLGPRRYSRSDERVREDVSDRLTDDWLLNASDVEVEVSNCEATLNGQVNSRADKRRAEDIVEGISGVRHVQNNLRVKGSSVETRRKTA